MKNSLQSNKFLFTVVTFCGIFIQDIKDFCGLNIFRKKNRFKLKKKIMHTFPLVFVFIYQPIAGSVISEKNVIF